MLPEDLESRVEAILRRHVGEANRIGMAELYYQVMGEACGDLIDDTREVRRAVGALRDRGRPICSTSSARHPGYWWETDALKLRQAVQPLIDRGLTSLRQASRMIRLGVPVLLGQLKLEEERRAQGDLFGE